MPERKIERKTIFLYPQTMREDTDSYIEISQLITDIKTIINISNKQIEELLCDTCFSEIKCMPSVTMRCIGETNQSFNDYKNVRICIIKYNEYDYSDNYKDIIKSYNNGSSDISHLIALHINQKCNKVKFYKESDNDFDVVVETGLDFLDKLLISIMLDISIYHYFCLSSSIDNRKRFNVMKYKYLYKKYKMNTPDNIYGQAFSEKEKLYLPFSLYNVIQISENSKNEKENIEDLISEFAEFLVESMAEKVQISKNGTVCDPYDHKKDTYEILEKYIERNIDSLETPCVIIIFDQKATKNSLPIVLNYDKESNRIPSWAEKLMDDSNGYDIYKLQKDVKK